MANQEHNPLPLAYCKVRHLAEAGSVSRTTVRNDIKDGKILDVREWRSPGSRRPVLLIPVASARAWLASLPRYKGVKP